MRGVGIVVLMLLAACRPQPAEAKMPPIESITASVGTPPSPWFLDPAVLPAIICANKKGAGVGTAVVIGGNRAVTAKHLTEDRECVLEGRKVTVVRELAPDVVEIAFDGTPAPFRAIIGCDGIVEGGDYYATGHALGLPYVVTQRLVGTSATTQGKSSPMKGSVTPGQSGGEVSDRDGRFVGVIDAYSEHGITMAYITPLKGTALCPSSSS